MTTRSAKPRVALKPRARALCETARSRRASNDRAFFFFFFVQVHLLRPSSSSSSCSSSSSSSCSCSSSVSVSSSSSSTEAPHLVLDALGLLLGHRVHAALGLDHLGRLVRRRLEHLGRVARLASRETIPGTRDRGRSEVRSGRIVGDRASVGWWGTRGRRPPRGGGRGGEEDGR